MEKPMVKMVILGAFLVGLVLTSGCLQGIQDTAEDIIPNTQKVYIKNIEYSGTTVVTAECDTAFIEDYPDVDRFECYIDKVDTDDGNLDCMCIVYKGVI